MLGGLRLGLTDVGPQPPPASMPAGQCAAERATDWEPPLRAVIADLRQERDRSLADSSPRTAIAVPAPRPASPEKPPMTWWRWLRSTG